MNKKKESKVVPNVRFKGFTDDWKQRKLGDIADVTKLAGFEFTEHVVYSDEGNIIALRGLNIKNGQLILDDVKYIDGSNFSKLSRSKLFIDDIMFTYVGTVGEVAIIKENDRFYLAPNVSRIRVKSDDSPKFISHYMRTDNFKNKVIFPLIATSSQPALSMENIRKFTINIPISREEQDCLAKYFDSLDRLITLHQQKITLLTKLKKAMLEKMFPKKGAVIPEIRFNGFANAWEQQKISDVSKITTGGTPSTKVSEYWNPGEIPWLSSGEVHKKYIAFTDNMISGTGMENSSARMVQENSVLIALAGQGKTRGTVAINRIPLTTNQSIAAMTFDNTMNPEFVFSNLEIRYDELRSISSGDGSRGGLNKQLIGNIIIPRPSLEEQIKIGEFFKDFNNLITLHKRKIDMLKKLKSACLSEMFI